MNPGVDYHINQITFHIENQRRDYQKLFEAYDKATKVPYELRNKIEQQIRGKVPSEKIVEELLKELKAMTPHGASYKIDP